MELCWRCSVEFQEDVAHLINSPEDGCLLPVRGAPTKPRETGQQCGMANCWRFRIFWSFFELKGMESIQIQAGEASKTAKTPVFSLFPSRLTQHHMCWGCSRPSEWIGRAGYPCQWFHGNWFCCWGMDKNRSQIMAEFGGMYLYPVVSSTPEVFVAFWSC